MKVVNRKNVLFKQGGGTIKCKKKYVCICYFCFLQKLKLQEYLESSTKSGLLAPTNKAIEKAFASRKVFSLFPCLTGQL